MKIEIVVIYLRLVNVLQTQQDIYVQVLLFPVIPVPISLEFAKIIVFLNKCNIVQQMIHTTRIRQRDNNPTGMKMS